MIKVLLCIAPSRPSQLIPTLRSTQNTRDHHGNSPSEYPPVFDPVDIKATHWATGSTKIAKKKLGLGTILSRA